MNEKIELTPEQRLIVHQEFLLRKKQAGALLVFWLLLGGCGGHRFYLGHHKIGLLLAVTFGGFGFGLAVDLFLMWVSLKRHNEALKLSITERMVEFVRAGGQGANTTTTAA